MRRCASRPSLWPCLLPVLLVAGSLLPPATARAGTPLALSETHGGHVNFVGTAGSLRRGSNSGDACAVDNYDSAVLAGLPPGATIRAAYLYWAGSWSNTGGSTQRSPDWNVTLDGAAVTAGRQFTETYGTGGTSYNFFSGRADVTSLVAAKGNGIYTFGNLDVNTGRPHCDVQAVLAGWSLIVVYEHAAESNRVVNVFDGFVAYRGGQVSVTATNFQVAANDINGKVAHLTWEGDAENSDSLAGYNENLRFNGNVLVDPFNPVNNQFNSTVNVSGRSDTWGVDLDIYDVTPYLSAGDTQATTVYQSGQDLVLLSAEVISVTNIPLVDLGFKADPNQSLGLFEPEQITLALVNNGPSDEAGAVVLSATLPPGLVFLGGSGSGWVLAGGAPANPVFIHPGPLPAGQGLPLVLTVRADDTAAANPQMGVSVTGGSFDFDPTNNAGTVSLTVYTPDAELASTSFVQTVDDPINGTANPKAIPGATLDCATTTTNQKAGRVDRNSVEVVLAVPPVAMLRVGDYPGGPGGPILFVDGSPSSGLSIRLRGDGTSRDIDYSDDGGASFNHTPVPDAQGCDGAITHIRVRPRGRFDGRDATGPSGFTLRFRVTVR